MIKSYLRRERIPEAVLPDKTKDHVNSNLIGTKVLSERLGVAKSQIYRLTNTGKIPMKKVGKYYRYDYEEVLEALGSTEAIVRK